MQGLLWCVEKIDLICVRSVVLYVQSGVYVFLVFFGSLSVKNFRTSVFR